MSRVFTWEEIVDRRVPKLPYFAVVVAEMRKALEFEEGVLGAVLCGSVLNKTHTRGSDIDCFLVYDDAKKQEVFNVLQFLVQFAHQLHIPVEFIPVSQDMAKKGMHTVGLGFGYHLIYSAQNGGGIKDATGAISALNMSGCDKLREAREYLLNKYFKLSKGLARMPAMSSEELCRYLQKVLEAPVHMARKVLHAKNELHNYVSSAVPSAYFSLVVRAQEVGLFVKVTTAQEQYCRMLTSRLENPDHCSYYQVIRDLEKLAPDVIELARFNLSLVS